MRRILFELLTKRADRDPQILGLPFLRRAPRGAQQMRVREHSTRLLGELGKDGIFFWGEVHILAVARHLAVEKVDRHSVTLDGLLAGRRRQVEQIGQIALKL